MSSRRRQFLQLTAATMVASVPSLSAWALDYPTRPVRLVVGFPPGGATDILARLIGQWLSERLGQPFVIENRPGASSNIGTEMVVRAAADGYTLLFIGSPNVINATVYSNLSFDFVRDIAPVASVSTGPLVMVVNPSVPAENVQEFIAYAKANPGKINMGSNGIGSSGHVAGELFNMMAGVNMVHVPYRGGAAALSDLLSGQVQVNFSTLPGAIGYIKARRLRALAVTGAMRLPEFPELPTIGEFLRGFEATVWGGIGAPRNTPLGVIERLNREINAGLADPGLKSRIAELGGGAVLVGSPVEFNRLIVEDTERWAKVVKFAGIRAQ